MEINNGNGIDTVDCSYNLYTGNPGNAAFFVWLMLGAETIHSVGSAVSSPKDIFLLRSIAFIGLTTCEP